MKPKLLFFLSMLIGNASGLSLEPPERWVKTVPNQPGVFIQYVSPKREHNFTPNLIVAKENLKVDRKEMATPIAVSNYVEEIQKRVLPMFKVVEKREEKRGPILGVVMVGTYAFGEADLVAYQFIFRKRDDIFTVVFTCLLNDLVRFKPIFDRSLKTISIDEHGSEM